MVIGLPDSGIFMLDCDIPWYYTEIMFQVQVQCNVCLYTSILYNKTNVFELNT